MSQVITGWGRGTWSEGPWNSPIPVVVTGVEAAGEVGTVTISIGTTAAVTGVSATAALGTAIAGSSITAFPEGVEAAGQVTGPIVWGPQLQAVEVTWTDIAA